MQSQDRAVFFPHHLLAYGHRLIDHPDFRSQHGREYRRGPMLLMGSYRTMKSLFRTFGEVEAPTAMDIHGDKARDDRHSFRVHHLGANHR